MGTSIILGDKILWPESDLEARTPTRKLQYELKIRWLLHQSQRHSCPVPPCKSTVENEQSIANTLTRSWDGHICQTSQDGYAQDSCQHADCDPVVSVSWRTSGFRQFQVTRSTLFEAEDAQKHWRLFNDHKTSKEQQDKDGLPDFDWLPGNQLNLLVIGWF